MIRYGAHMCPKLRFLGAAASILVATLLAQGVARAESVAPSQVIPQSLKPAPTYSSSIVVLSAAGLTPPPNASALSITLSNIIVEGGFPELQDQTTALTATIRGKRVTLAEVYATANAIAQAYASEGYVLARVVVPSQKLVNGGALRLVVVDGFIESVDVKGIPQRQQTLVAQRTASLVGRRHIKLAEIERRLLLTADDPGLHLRSTLARGEQASGGTKLVLEATQDPVAGVVGYDNYLPSSLGISEFNASLALNSTLGYGEQIYASATTGYDLGESFQAESPIQVLGVGVSIPVGNDGIKINPEYTNSVTRPLPQAGVPDTVGYYERFAFRVSDPVILTRSHSLTLQASYEWQEEHEVASAFNSDVYSDNYSAIRLQAEDQMQWPFGAVTDATLIFSQGIGGRDAADVAASGIPLSQQGASPTFSKLNFNGRWSQQLLAGFQSTVNLYAQTSFGQPLFLAEQLGLNGPYQVSSYPLGTFVVDEGATVRGELSYPFSLARFGLGSVAPYAFGAYGAGVIDQPTALEQADIRAGSIGLGARIGANATGLPLPLGATLSLEVARQYTNVAGEEQGYRANIGLAINF
jgi:hemolysin activation/secretion protein